MIYFPNLLSTRSLIYLTAVLLMNGCKRADLEPESQPATIEIKNNPDESEQYKDIEIKNDPCNTMVVFLGSPGVGKSALCNSIFQKNTFKSGISFVGVTKEMQEHTIGDIKYIDTPGLDDLISKEKATQEIEKALRGNNNYKVIFVAMLEGERIRASDLATINSVCDAIHEADFEYGIIFNKMNKGALNYINTNRDEFINFLSPLHKRPNPEWLLFIEEEGNMRSKSGIHFSIESENYTKLLEYVNKLKPIKINCNNVSNININNYQEQVEVLETELSRIRREQAKKIEEMKKKHREEISLIKIAIDKQVDLINVAFIEAKEKLEISLVERGMQEQINSLKNALKNAFDVFITNMENEPNLNKEKFEEARKKIDEAIVELDDEIKNIKKTIEDKFKETIGSDEPPLHKRQL